MAKPGEKALLAMKELDKAMVVFKKPAVPKTKKENKVILNEETYLEEMAKIIQRDFFPDLQKLKAQNEYLDAVASNDIIKLRQIFSKYNSKSPLVREPSPATFETPLPSASLGPDEPPSIRSTTSVKTNKSSKSLADKHSLDSFLQNFTSEDNDSFQEIIEAADKKLRQKFSVLYEAEKTTMDSMSRSLALPSIESQFDNKEKPKQLDMWTYKNKNYIMYIPDGVAISRKEEIELANKKQEIEHSNTRLRVNPFNDQESKQAITEAAKSQAKCLPEKIGVDGKLIEASFTPDIRGFSFVKSPSPCPGITDSPLFTWGEIEGTPFRLDGGDTPLHPSTAGSSFRIAETSKRENLALQLAEKVAEQSRSKKAKAIEAARRNIASPAIRNTFDRLASMSPAARKLASSKLGFINTPSPMRSPSMASTLKTPRPIGISRTTPSPAGIVRKKTPIVAGSSSNSNVNKSDSNKTNSTGTSVTLTDNLLYIPSTAKRQKASDFF
ncbi:splicing factor ESS-2 homolog [Toxorhynchites rutilus septentrionalis]|uniref:splicing factor ESS-2 homolog n=1 Tax=Toxorhynchites rutilus septentrionalis TaxID=329112 RepID=UPI00247B0C2F|nr:splicing factor ESS-2 homolog [Toxorhynchites rutilus septentrionalis]